MRYFLAKTEPASYSLSQLETDRTTTWDGVTNPQAVKAIRSMRPGDRVFIYHSGGESAIAGVADVVSEPRDAPPKSAVVDLAFRSRLDPPLTLHEVKESGLFADWALVRQGRLSTMEVPSEFVQWLRKLRPGANF